MQCERSRKLMLCISLLCCVPSVLSNHFRGGSIMVRPKLSGAVNFEEVSRPPSVALMHIHLPAVNIAIARLLAIAISY